jgi:transposase
VKEQLVYLGVDIAKSYLDAAVGNEKGRFANDAIGHGELIKWIKQFKAPVQVICESSGGYERALVRALVRAQLKISLVQANRVRQFARAAGIMAKTDRIDAELLCEFGKVMRPQTVTAAKLEQEHLRELESQRRHLTHLLVMELNRGARVSDASVQRLNRRLINQIKNQIEQLDQSSQTDLHQRSRCAHGSITPGAVTGIRRTQSS